MDNKLSKIFHFFEIATKNMDATLIKGGSHSNKPILGLRDS